MSAADYKRLAGLIDAVGRASVTDGGLQSALRELGAEVVANRDTILAALSAAPELLAALEETWRVLRAAGLLNLTRGVQLGQTSWYVKACDAEALSDAAIAAATGAA